MKSVRFIRALIGFSCLFWAFSVQVKAQTPDVELRQIQMLDDGTAAIRLSVTYRNMTGKPFQFAYFHQPEKVFLQKKGFVTKVFMENYAGIDQPTDWVSTPIEFGASTGQLVHTDILPGDLFMADIVYKVDPEHNFEIILDQEERISFSSLVSHILHDFGNPVAFQQVMAGQPSGCESLEDLLPELSPESLNYLKARVTNLKQRFQIMEREVNWSII